MRHKISVTKRGVVIDGINVTDKLQQTTDGRRHLIYHKDIIIKFEDLDQCKHEIRMWTKKIKKKDKKYFVPIIDYRIGCELDEFENLSSNTGYIVQNLVRFRKGRPSNTSRRIIKRLGYRYNVVDIEEKVCGRNWCINKETGLPIIFDYGV